MRIFMAESGVLSSWEALEMKSLRIWSMFCSFSLIMLKVRPSCAISSLPRGFARTVKPVRAVCCMTVLRSLMGRVMTELKYSPTASTMISTATKKRMMLFWISSRLRVRSCREETIITVPIRRPLSVTAQV